MFNCILLKSTLNGIWVIKLGVCGCCFISVAGCLRIGHDSNYYTGSRQVNGETLPESAAMGSSLVPLSPLFTESVYFHWK